MPGRSCRCRSRSISDASRVARRDRRWPLGARDRIAREARARDRRHDRAGGAGRRRTSTPRAAEDAMHRAIGALWRRRKGRGGHVSIKFSSEDELQQLYDYLTNTEHWTLQQPWPVPSTAAPPGPRAALLVLAVPAPLALRSQERTVDGSEWPTYGGDPRAGTLAARADLRRYIVHRCVWRGAPSPDGPLSISMPPAAVRSGPPAAVFACSNCNGAIRRAGATTSCRTSTTTRPRRSCQWRPALRQHAHVQVGAATTRPPDALRWTYDPKSYEAAPTR